MKILIIMFGAVLLTNPLTNQYLLELLEIGMFYATYAAPYTTTVFAASVVFYAGVKYAKSERINIPKKSSVKKTEKYLTT